MFFDRLGKLVTRHWVVVLLAWLAVVVVVHHWAPRWDDVTHDGDFAYLPDEMASVRGTRLLEEAFPDFYSKSQVALVVAREEGRLTADDLADDLAVAGTLLAALGPYPDESDAADEPSDPPESATRAPSSPVTAAWSFDTPIIGKKLISPPSEEGQAALVVLHLRNEFMAVDNMAFLRRVYRTLDQLRHGPDFPKGLRLGVTGSAAIGSDMLFSAQESIRNTELTTIVMVVFFLLVVYRAPGLVLVPLVTIGASVWLAMDLVAIAAQWSDSVSWFDFKIFKTTRIFVVVLLFGAGTDFCLFLIARYKEELRRGLDYPAAAAEALARVGSALAASALTTVFGLAMMAFADFGKFSNSGPAIAVCLVVTFVACVTLAPALLRGTGATIFWPFGAKVAREDIAPRRAGVFWDRVSRAIIARPGLILAASLLLLLPLTRPARVLTENLASGNLAAAQWPLAVPVTYDLLAELRADRPSVRGTHLLWRYFPADQTGPLTILVHQPGADFNNRESRTEIAWLTRRLFEFEYIDASGRTVRPIVGVRSLTEPMGDAPGSFNPLSTAGRGKLIAMHNPRTRARFVSQTPGLAGQVARFDVISSFAPFSRDSVDLLNRLEEMLHAETDQADSPLHGADVAFAGTTAGIRDLETVTASDRLRIQLLVMLAVLAVLIVLLRRPLVCVYLILSVLLGYGVTIGATDLLFGWIYGAAYTGLDWKVPIFLFVILIAVGQDYNIYLVTRVVEEQRRLGPVEGLRVAVVRTGGIITSCGAIMAGTFASMITGTLQTMQQLGFALALGVLLDTFVIRTILVPAFLAILARREERRTASEVSAEMPSRHRPKTVSV